MIKSGQLTLDIACVLDLSDHNVHRITAKHSELKHFAGPKRHEVKVFTRD